MMNFQNYSGKNIKIAILDSGVKVEHPDFKVCKIKNYLISNDKYLKDDIGDVDFGHGTACAWLIHKIAPKAEIFSFRCFDKSGRGDVQKILNTLHWCIQNDIDIINLSFGAFSSLYLNEFELVGQEAKQKNTLIFASCHDSGYMSIPAKLENYVAVCGKSVKGKYKYYYSDNRFIAHG